MRSSIFNPSVMLLSGGIIADPSAQSHIGNEEIIDDEPSPYDNINPYEENRSITIEEPAVEPTESSNTNSAESTVTE